MKGDVKVDAPNGMSLEVIKSALPIGKPVKIGEHVYRVIGHAEEKGIGVAYCRRTWLGPRNTRGKEKGRSPRTRFEDIQKVTAQPGSKIVSGT